MERETKRILAFILAIVMCISLADMPVSAKQDNQVENIEGMASLVSSGAATTATQGASTTPSGVITPSGATTTTIPGATTTPPGVTTPDGICSHEEGQLELIIKEAATCTGSGIAYKTCKECGEIIESNIIIEPLGHKGGKATCHKKAVCIICQEEYGELDKSKHGKLEIRNAKAATCKDHGYSGDVHCKDCGDITMMGEIIPKTEKHTWDEGKITKKATIKKKGVKTYTCTLCGHTKTEEITVVGAAKGSILIDNSNKAEYEVTKAGITGGTVSYVQPVNSKTTSVTIPATITLNGIKYKVTGISKNACMNLNKLKKVTIGKNIKKIGKRAFFGCKKLTKITVKTKKLTLGNVKEAAFKGVYKKAVFNVPNAKKDAYTKIFRRRGGGKKIKVK